MTQKNDTIEIINLINKQNNRIIYLYYILPFLGIIILIGIFIGDLFINTDNLLNTTTIINSSINTNINNITEYKIICPYWNSKNTECINILISSCLTFFYTIILIIIGYNHICKNY